MPLLGVGGQLPNQVSFNSGTLDINGLELAILQNISFSADVAVKEIRAMGTILMPVPPKRHGFKVVVKAKTRSINKELLTFFLGSSSADAPGFDYSLFDGQNVLTRASIRCIMNEDPTKIWEFQLSNAVMTGSLALALKMEDPAEMDIEIIAANVTVVTNF